MSLDSFDLQWDRLRMMGGSGHDADLTALYKFAEDKTLAAIDGLGQTLGITRTTEKRVFDSAGLLSTVSAGAAGFDHNEASPFASLGLLVEEQRENIVRNSIMDGVTEPSTFPTNWSMTTNNGGSASIIDSGAHPTLTGYNFIDVRVQGTASNSSILIWMEGVGNPTTSAGISVSHSFYVQLIAGSLSGTQAYQNEYRQADTTFISNTTIVAFTATSTLTRIKATATTPALCGIARPRMSWFAIGDGGDYTIRIVAPQMEEAATVGNLIPTESSTVTRNADVISADISSELGAANTLFVSAKTGKSSGVVCQIDDGTEDERYRVERNGSDEIHVISTDGGVDLADLNLGAVADDTAFKVAVRFDTNDFAASLDGAAVVTDTGGTLPTVDTIHIGMDSADDEWGSTIDEVYLYGVGKNDAFIQELSNGEHPE